MIKGEESYEALKSFKPVLDDINKLIKQGKIEVEGQSYSLEFFLGGDYKVHVINCINLLDVHNDVMYNVHTVSTLDSWPKHSNFQLLLYVVLYPQG